MAMFTIERDYGWEDAMKEFDPATPPQIRENDDFNADYNAIAIEPSGILSNQDRPIKKTIAINTDDLFVNLPQSNRIRSVKAAATISDFARYTWQALQLWDSRIKFQPLTSPTPIDATTKVDEGTNALDSNLRIITWHVYKRTPGSLGPYPHSQKCERKPRVREVLVADNTQDIFRDELEDPDPSVSRIIGYQTEGQMYDNTIQFDIWSNSAYVAEETAEIFEDFMENFRGEYRKLGVNQMAYGERVRDEFLMQKSNTLKVRSIRYFIRTEMVKAIPIHPIKSIEINAEYLTSLAAISRPEDYLRHREAEIIRKWATRYKREL